MRALILEDEALAAERLQLMLEKLRPDIEILAILDTVEDAVSYFSTGVRPDLAFFDIQLADGASFQVFESVKVPCPVIFTTAYDQYTLKAFKVNSIDYLLKPIGKADLEQALAQYEDLKEKFGQPTVQLKQVEQLLQSMQRQYKERFVVKTGHQFLSIRAEDIRYLFTEHKTTWIRHADGKKHALEYTLEELEALLDPKHFFRTNRQYIVHIEAIDQTTVYSNARLKIKLQDGEETTVSRDRVSDFRTWLGG
ncbi:LytR/AlgR family response regulator transcription factor [Phaeodactylibacter xiamenensis]|uniref:LytR/AlgR family response regulator transcription factor n=1 Tax=Phaeodactylibacter xiamenensis TaxID=1524460 RepID=UPI003BACD0D0